jgi:Mg2+ and Co2+ transporter CorA
LNNVESWFEDGEKQYDQKTLQALLQHLMRARRRVTKYDTLVSDQVQLCPAHWNHEPSHRDPKPSSEAQTTAPSGRCPVAHSSTPSGSCPMPHSSTPAQSLSTLLDFQQVRDHLSHNKARIAQAIKLVTSLMAIQLNELVVEQNDTLLKHNRLTEKQNKLSEARNSSLAFLTGVTSFLLPFTTVAAFMAIPSDSGFGPGSEKQWVFWVSAGVLALSLMLAFGIDFVYERGKASQPEADQEQAKPVSGTASNKNNPQAKGEKKEIRAKNKGITAISSLFRRRASLRSESENIEAQH